MWLLTQARLCFRWTIWSLLSTFWDQLQLRCHSYNENQEEGLCPRAHTTPAYSELCGLRSDSKNSFVISNIRELSDVHGAYFAFAARWNEIQHTYMKWLWVKATGKFGIGSQSGKCGCGCQLAPCRPNEPQPSGRTPKLCFLDSWWTTYKRQESCSNKSGRHKKVARQRWQENERAEWLVLWGGKSTITTHVQKSSSLHQESSCQLKPPQM